MLRDPIVNSSLTFLRKTQWAHEKVESLYLFTLRETWHAQHTPVQHSDKNSHGQHPLPTRS